MKYLRIKALYLLMAPFSKAMRGARMRAFEKAFALKPGEKILDLGGQPEIWSHVETPLDIVIVNLPGVASAPPEESVHKFEFRDGDACDLSGYSDKSFDIVFSNSVIEHVGGPEREAAFAKEVRRVGRRYWVQTPSIWFPIEAHTGVPFWFRLPGALRRRMIARWAKKLPAWTEMVRGTTVLSRRAFGAYFDDAEIVTEWSFGFPKSYVARRR
jgi:SAM-dependent methyltransferase